MGRQPIVSGMPFSKSLLGCDLSHLKLDNVTKFNTVQGHVALFMGASTIKLN